MNVQPVIPISINEDWNVITLDDFGADWQVRAMVQFLFPK